MSATAGLVRHSGSVSATALFALLVGYGVGLTGTLWDDLEHAGVVGLNVALAHALAYLGGLLALGAAIVVLRRGRPEPGSSRASERLASAGAAVLLVGVLVDIAWHALNPDASERIMVLLPGHAIQHIGWLLGLAGVVTLLALRHGEEQERTS